MDYLTKHNLQFNPKSPTIMHIDLNSCFATIEQQANHHLRGKPVVVAAYSTPSACIIAPSVEAKALGIKVGMRVKDGRLLCPNLIIREPDPWKYRNVHLQLRRLLEDYTNNINPKSIDEFVLNLEGYPAYSKGMKNVAKEIKKRIKEEIGDWLTVSVGIAPNIFLAKTASGLHKPDGLDEVNRENFLEIYKTLELKDLCGIKTNNTVRLNKVGIFTVVDFYNASIQKLKSAFQSIVGFYWYLRLKGWEIDDVVFGRNSFGNSYAIPDKLSTSEQLAPILMKLVEKMSRRMRKAGYKARGVHVSLLYKDGNHWHLGGSLEEELFFSGDIYKTAYKILKKSPYKSPVHILAVSCYKLTQGENLQLNMFENTSKKHDLAKAVDKINDKWGEFVITPAKMLGMSDKVIDRISFGGIKELEEEIAQNYYRN